jgi:hypothetical protein
VAEILTKLRHDPIRSGSQKCDQSGHVKQIIFSLKRISDFSTMHGVCYFGVFLLQNSRIMGIIKKSSLDLY